MHQFSAACPAGQPGCCEALRVLRQTLSGGCRERGASSSEQLHCDLPPGAEAALAPNGSSWLRMRHISEPPARRCRCDICHALSATGTSLSAGMKGVPHGCLSSKPGACASRAPLLLCTFAGGHLCGSGGRALASRGVHASQPPRGLCRAPQRPLACRQAGRPAGHTWFHSGWLQLQSRETPSHEQPPSREWSLAAAPVAAASAPSAGWRGNAAAQASAAMPTPCWNTQAMERFLPR